MHSLVHFGRATLSRSYRTIAGAGVQSRRLALLALSLFAPLQADAQGQPRDSLVRRSSVAWGAGVVHATVGVGAGDILPVLNLRLGSDAFDGKALDLTLQPLGNRNRSRAESAHSLIALFAPRIGRVIYVAPGIGAHFTTWTGPDTWEATSIGPVLSFAGGLRTQVLGRDASIEGFWAGLTIDVKTGGAIVGVRLHLGRSVHRERQ